MPTTKGWQTLKAPASPLLSQVEHLTALHKLSLNAATPGLDELMATSDLTDVAFSLSTFNDGVSSHDCDFVKFASQASKNSIPLTYLSLVDAITASRLKIVPRNHVIQKEQIGEGGTMTVYRGIWDARPVALK